MTRLVLIGDTHGQKPHHDIPDGDILIHTGDSTRRGSLGELATLNNTFFKLLPHRYKVLIAGNHDWAFQQDPGTAKACVPDVIYLQDEAIELMGLKVWGSPWQPRFFDWAFNLDRGQELAAKWALIPNDTDILVTHSPPRGILDYSTYEHKNVGCDDLLDAVRRVKPRVHVFGHIHGAYGVVESDGTVFVNASTCTEGYAPTNPPIVLDV